VTSSSQILLPLESRSIDRFENFFTGPNQNVVFGLKELLRSPGACLFISAAEGSGKSHLLNAVCNHAREEGLEAFYLTPGRLPKAAAKGLTGLEQMDVVCIDDIDQVAGQAQWENALFHFFNRLHASKGRLVVSSRQPLSHLQFNLPDLASRLAWGLRLQLEPLDDDGKLAVIRNKADALGINLPPEVASYLIRRSSRDMVTLLANLEAIRVAALTGKRKISVPLAREVLTKD
jgi:DnaA family protein